MDTFGNYVITIARGFGSGGKQIGLELSKRLGIPCYESRILNMASNYSGINKDLFFQVDEKLIDSEGVAIIFGCWTSSSRKAVKPIVEEYDALLWYPVQYEGMESSSNIVYTGVAPNQQIVPAIDYLIEKGYKKFFLLGSDYVFPRTANMIINAQVENAGLEVVGEEYADMDQTDFAAIIAKIEAAQPDVIVNTLNGTGNVSFFKQMSEKNYTSKDYMTMSFSIAEEEVATIGSDILQGHLVSWNYYQTTDTEKNTAFVKAYKEKYGEDRVTSDPAEAAYDAVYLWKAAC